MYKRILVATGGSPWSHAAVTYAIALAMRTDAVLHILTVLTNPGSYATPDVLGATDIVVDLIERQGQGLLAQAADEAAAAGVTCETISRWGGRARDHFANRDRGTERADCLGIAYGQRLEALATRA
nr:universal stress protein [Candidatus Entotheonella palauensis]